MAANKFATMLHRNTHKFTVILVYAILEWILILLLLLNSFFSYLIVKFAKYFGLKNPCLWCSRVDHVMEPNRNTKSYRDLICETHATEISKLGYCPNHHKLFESNNMCSDCSPSRLPYNGSKFIGNSQIAFFTWVSKNIDENSEKNYIVHQSSDDCTMKEYDRDYESPGIVNLPSQSSGCCDVGRLIPVKFIDSITISSQRSFKHEEDENYDCVPWIETQVELVGKDDALHMTNESSITRCGGLENLEIGKIESPSIQMTEQVIEGLVTETRGEIVPTQAAKSPHNDDKEIEAAAMKEQDNSPAAEEDNCILSSDEMKSNIMMGTEVSDYEPADHTQAQEPTSPLSFRIAHQSSMDNESLRIDTRPDSFVVQKDQESKEVDEEKFQLAPTDMDNLHQLHKKLVLFEKRETGTEDSWDGSVISEMEGDNRHTTIEKLKSALKSQRKAVSALYAELEEERSAAAIGANQTMAMITRLQEEKAAMKMEALQYQRMMEEQSEYDQEALQLLNELMIKREKEYQELENELDMYRKKVLDYETKENLMTLRMKQESVRIRHSPVSSSNAYDNDDLSIDRNREGRGDFSGFYDHEETSNNTPLGRVIDLEEMGIECVKHLCTLDESVAEFEEERQSILEELKALEERLFILADDEEQSFEDERPIEHFIDEYAKEFDENYGLRNS